MLPLRGAALSPFLLCAACHAGGLTVIAGALQFTAPADPGALTQPTASLVEIDFGQVTIDSAKTLTVDLSSLTGQVKLGALTPTQPDPEFTLPFTPGTVVGTAPTAISLSFTPASLGTKTATYDLTDYSPGAATVVIQLTGQGIADGLQVAPNPFDFGAVELNQSQVASLTITNQGSLPAHLEVSPAQGTDAALFALGSPLTATLAPGASTTMTATFAPLIAGTASASFTIDGWSTSDPITVNLAGTGVASWLQVTPLLDFNYVQINRSFVKSATVTNLSNYATFHLVAPLPAVTGKEFNLLSFAPTPIAPGQSIPVEIGFSPYAYGPASGSLSLNTDDPLGQHPVVALEGYGGGPEIYCQPRLAFEPSLVGVAQTEQLLCTNVGTNIPGHPEISLQFRASDVTTDNPAFTAALDLPGPVPTDAGVSLLSGQTVSIDVTCDPIDAGPLFSKLTIASNDLNDADAGTLLSGVGVTPGQCFLQLAPAALNFAEVPKGDVGKMQFSLSNVGQDYCLVTDVRVDPTSDPAFSLPVGLPAPQTLSFVGNPGFSDGLPTSLLFEAQFAPMSSQAASVGIVDVTAFDTPTLAIPLTGSSLAGCLGIQPSGLDFGVVGFNPRANVLCLSDSLGFAAVNLCSEPLTISQITLAPGPYPAPQFALEAGPAFPFVLDAGDQAYVIAGFTPGTVGPKIGDLLVSSSDLPQTPYLVTLEGDPELMGMRTDRFTVPTPPKKVDLAWILDNDDDQSSIATLASVLPQLIDALNQSQIDYQIAVTSTDTCNESGSDQGSFEPCDHCLSTAQSNPIFITSSTAPDPATGLGDLFGLFALPDPAQCAALIGDEHLFDAIADAFSPTLLAGHNSGFIRSDAYLAVLMANGDDEDDGANVEAGTKPYYATSLTQAIATIEALKPDPSQVSFSYVYVGNAGFGVEDVPTAMGALIQATGGLAINAGAATWESQLISLFSYGGEAQAFFTLASTPVDPTKLQVSVNGVAITDWILNGNQLVLTGSPAPAPGAIVTVTYQVGC